MAESEKLRVLIAEDNPGDVAILEHILMGTGTELRHTNSLEGLREDGRVWDPDVILLDLHLEDSQDFMVTARTVVSLFPTIPVVAVTSLDEKEHALRALQAGVSAYLIKGTLSGQDLMKHIQEAIARKKAQYRSMATAVSQDELRAMVKEAVEAAMGDEPEPETPKRTVALAVLAVVTLLGATGAWAYSQFNEAKKQREEIRRKSPEDIRDEKFQEFQDLRNEYMDARMRWEASGEVGPKPKKPPRLLQLEQELAQ